MEIMGEALRHIGELGWSAFQAINRRIPESESPRPDWAPGPLLKSRQRSQPPLGFPRRTDSLCPTCVVKTRNEIVRGERDLSALVNGHEGEIPAMLVEEDGKIFIRKTCDKHGPFEDVLSIDAEWSRTIERRYPGRDFPTLGDELIHRHGTSSIRYGRGAVLTIDLTNRCNMMCNPCFMDANQVGYVHELTMDEIKRILDDSISFKPRRQMSVQFSGGEPTLSPHFLEACSYAKKVGYYQVQAATNGLRFALEPEFAFEAKEAGFDMAYLQFDGVTNESNSHRHISNLFDAKQLAIDNFHKAGLSITPVTTVVNTVNEKGVGPLLEFVIENSDKNLGGISFQPVSFTGRDEEISDADRHRQRYTISHLAHEFARYFDGKIDPYRDWFPLGSAGAFASLADHLRGPDVQFGGLSCSCHPNCGSAVMMMVNERTKAWAPLSAFFNLDRFMEDIRVIVDTARGRALSLTQIGLSFLRNYDQSKAPAGLTIEKLLRLVNRRMGGAFTHGQQPPQEEWKLLWIGGMWFQDLWTYDFRRTEMCVIPYATQEGEISFCAYNTGVGWRQIVENMHMVATTGEWFAEKGRHKIYAGNRPIPLPKSLKRQLPVIVENGNGNGREKSASSGCGTGCGCH